MIKKKLNKNKSNKKKIMFNNEHYCFETLSNKNRLKIIKLLKEKKLSVNEISKELNIERTNISHNLSILLNCNIITFEKKGKNRIYSINKETPIFKKGNIFENIEEHKKKYCKNKCQKKDYKK